METFGENVLSGCSSLPVINNIRYADTYLIEATDKTLATYNIKEGTKYIGHSAFSECPFLASITIPESVTFIDENAFTDCAKLMSITIPEGTTHIGAGAFSGCSGLILVTINCATIGNWFSSLPSIKEIVIGKSVKSIGDDAFNGCRGVESVKIPTNIKNIGFNAFYGCSGMTSLVISEGVTRIGAYAFNGCSNLSSIIIPASVTDIENMAFFGCDKVEEVVIKGSIQSFGSYVFSGKSLRYVELNGDISSAPFADMTRIEEAVIGGKATSIFDGFFSGCSSLRKVTLGENIKDINIGSFNGNTKLDTLICQAVEVPYCYPHAFDGNIRKCTLVVPDKSHSLYSEAETWKNFKKVLGGWHTLTYMVEGEQYKQIKVQAGENVVKEAEPQKEGYTFSGWENLPDKMPAKNVIVMGSFDINSYRLRYLVDGEEYKTITLEYGSKIKTEEVPAKEGYTFSGWSEIPETMPAGDVTVTGTFTINSYKLTYILDGEEYKTSTLEYGSEIKSESVPEKEGYSFGGWDNLPKTMPAGDVTVTGTYSINSYTLTYILDGKEYKVLSVEYGSEIKAESVPEKEGYTFKGWKNLPKIMPAGDVIVTGTYSINSYTLTYILDGKEYKSSEMEYGTEIAPEAEPAKEGYTFSGWSEIPETMPAEDVTITGAFFINSYIMTYVLDGEEYKSFTLEYGSEITAESVPEKEGYTFSGWNNLPKTMPANDVTVYGSYITNSKDCLLTLKGINGGTFSLKCKTIATYSFQIIPEEGWKLSTLTYNGTDVTADVSDGSYTTPELTGDSELSIIFEQDGSDVKGVKSEGQLRVSTSNSALTIQNSGEDQQIAIYTSDGKMVKRGKAVHGTTSIPLQDGNVYLVKIGEKLYKLAM